DDDRSLGSSERRWSGDAFERRKQWSYAVQCNVLQVTLCAGGTAENQLPYSNVTRIEPCDERRNRAGRHEGACAGDVAHGFAHRLRHICALVENKLEQSLPRDTSAFHVIDTGDVEEVVFVVVRQEPFHLLRVHAAV